MFISSLRSLPCSECPDTSINARLKLILPTITASLLFERQLEIAGDALGQLRKIAPDLFNRVPDGDLIVGFRNVLAHGYTTLDHKRVYEAATLKAPELLKTLEGLLAEFPEE